MLSPLDKSTQMSAFGKITMLLCVQLFIFILVSGQQITSLGGFCLLNIRPSLVFFLFTQNSLQMSAFGKVTMLFCVQFLYSFYFLFSKLSHWVVSVFLTSALHLCFPCLRKTACIYGTKSRLT